MRDLSYAQTLCVKKAGLALQRSRALSPGSRIGVAVSGGVDSFVLLKVLKIRQKIVPFKYEIMALHINPGFDPSDSSGLADWLGREGVAGYIELSNHGPEAHSKVNRKKSPCFYCAMRRRKRLFQLAERFRLDSLAFGHNADDLLATFLLNFTRTGNIRGMDLRASFFGGKLHVIRPLLLVEKRHIRQAAAQWRLPIWQNSCPSSGKTDRALMNEAARSIGDLVPGAKKSMISALVNWELEKYDAIEKAPKFRPDSEG